MNPYLSTPFMPALILLLFICIILVYVARSKPVATPNTTAAQQPNDDPLDETPPPAPGKTFDQEYAEAEFVNKYCSGLSELVIDDRFSIYDLRKLLELNSQRLCVGHGWVPLLIDCVKEMEAAGWDRKVIGIKEKYAELRLSVTEKFWPIASKYCDLSRKTCEQCGAPGQIRYNSGWMTTSCRKHYVEDRGIVRADENGFTYGEHFLLWKDVVDLKVEEKTADGIPKAVHVYTTKKVLRKIHKSAFDYLFISSHRSGYGRFTQLIPEPWKTTFAREVALYAQPRSCEICGYFAVYADRCECCEHDTFEKYKSHGYSSSMEYDEFIKFNQMDWRFDDGEEVASQLHLYEKDPAFKLSYTEDEYQTFYQEINESDDW